jgi:hypothetical protein
LKVIGQGVNVSNLPLPLWEEAACGERGLICGDVVENSPCEVAFTLLTLLVRVI